MAGQSIKFRQFELRVSSYELRCSGEPVKLERIPMELLILLVERRGELVSREMIVGRLWGDGVFLETEHSINTAINKLRATLLDQPRSPVFIQTVIGKGYRFIADVEIVEPTINGNGHLAGPSQPPAFQTERGQVADQEPHLADQPQGSTSASHSSTPETPNGSSKDSAFPRAALEKTDAAEAPVVSKYLWMTWAGAALLLLLFLGFLAYRAAKRPAGTPAPVRYDSVAVLPFLDLSPDSGSQYLVDGMTDELITLLARGTSLRVISRTSTMQYKGAKKSLAEIASDLHVDAILEGSVMRSGKQIRITSQLLDAHRDQHLWAQNYQLSGGETLANQDKVIAEIARQVAQRLTNQTPRIIQPIVDSRALDLYLRGGYLWQQRTLEGLNKSISYYNQAIQIEPGFDNAYAALGRAYVLLASYGGPEPLRSLTLAQAAAEKALRLNSRLGEAHTVLAAVKVDRDWDWNGAEIEFQRALELTPSDPTAHHWYALHLARTRRFAEAESEMQRAHDLDPASIIVQTDWAEIAYYAHDPRRAKERLLRALELNGNFADAHLILGKIYEQLGNFNDALAEFQRAAQLFGNGPNVEALRGHALALAGRRTEAEMIATNLEAQAQQHYVSGADIGLIYCALGQPAKAMFWFERGYRDRDKGMDILGADPLFDGCRSDPHFVDLLSRMKLPNK